MQVYALTSTQHLSRNALLVRDGDVAPVEPSALEVLLWSAAAATVAVYALYTVAARDQSELSATVPFVAFGVARYLYLVHRDDLGEEAEKVLLQDTPTLLSVALWAPTAMWILTLS